MTENENQNSRCWQAILTLICSANHKLNPIKFLGGQHVEIKNNCGTLLDYIEYYYDSVDALTNSKVDLDMYIANLAYSIYSKGTNP